MSIATLAGGCLCGAIRYEIDAPPALETCCHCTLCRRASGAPFVAWFTVDPAHFRFTQGEPASYASSSRARRSFCATCGTQLTFRADDMHDEIDVTTCSLDDPERVPPRDHTWVRSQLSWISLADPLPRHTRRRE